MNSIHTAIRLANGDENPRTIGAPDGRVALPGPIVHRRLALHAMAAGGLVAGAPMLAWAQSTNIMAQGFYQRAKSLHEAGQHREALPYIARSKASLGGTNITLQYLHVMTLAGAKDYVAANAELQRFFALTDKSMPSAPFSNIVDRLTLEEQRELTRVMVEIMEKADAQGAVRAKEAKYAEAVSSLDRILAIAREFAYEYIVGKGTSTEHLRRTQTRDHTFRRGDEVSIGRVSIGFKNVAWVEVTQTTVANLKRISFHNGQDISRQQMTLFYHFVQPVRVDATNGFDGGMRDQWSFISEGAQVDARAMEAEAPRFNRLIGEYRAMP